MRRLSFSLTVCDANLDVVLNDMAMGFTACRRRCLQQHAGFISTKHFPACIIVLYILFF